MTATTDRRTGNQRITAEDVIALLRLNYDRATR